MQTLFGNGADGSPPGNCFAACVASILEVPLTEVPHVMPGVGRVWDYIAFTRDVNAYLVPRGLYLLDRIFDPELVPEWAWQTTPRQALLIASGPNVVTGLQHCVVLRDREIIHDPNPAGGGLAKITGLTYLVGLDPAIIEGTV